jgi:phosphate transport system permease protein
MIAIGLALLYYSIPALRKFGIGFFFSEQWNPVTQQFGALSSIYGTLVSTLLAMLLALPLSLAIALFLVELAPPRISRTVGTMIELLAAIPSIIYGMWGMFVFAPLMAGYVQPWLHNYLGWIPGLGLLFQGPPMGMGMLTAGIILGFMVLPFTCAITRDVFQMVPSVVKESAFGMGATTWEVTTKVTIPYGLVGIIGAFFMGLGRALGETMAVTFVIGNSHKINLGLFYPGNSIASSMANEFAEATELIYVSSLICLGLVLFVMTYLVQVVSQMMLRRMYRAWSVGL